MLVDKEEIEKRATKKIAIGTVLGYAALILSVISGIFFTPWIKRSIGNSMYGIYTLALSIINLFLIDFGLSNSINAFLSKYRAEGNIKDESRFLTATLKIYLILDLILLFVFVGAYLLIEYIYVGLTKDEIPILKNVFVILTGVSLLTFPGSLYNGILKSYEEFGAIKIIEIANKLIYVFLTAISLFLNLGIYAVVLSYAFSSLINAALLYFYARLKLKKKILLKQKISLVEYKQILSFSGYGFLASLASRFIFTIVPSILGIVSDSTNIAVFGVCSSLEGYVYSFSAVMSGFFMPKINRLSSIGGAGADTDKLDNLAIKVGRIQVAFVLLIVLGFISVGSYFVDFWMDYDPSFEPVYLGTILLITYQIINVAETIYFTAMSASKKTLRPLAFAYLLTGSLNIGLVFIFGYFWGAIGACFAIFVSHAIELIIINVLYKKYLNISLSKFFKKTYLGFLPLGVIGLIISLIFRFFLPFNSIINFIIGGAGIVLVYISLFWIGFGPKETHLFLKRLCQKKQKKSDIRNEKKSG